MTNLGNFLSTARAGAALLGLAAFVGCGPVINENVPPANVAGTYTVALTNGANGCMLDNWRTGETSNGTEVVITQDGSNATATVNGIPGGLLDIFLGSRRFSGTVAASETTMRLEGTRAQSSGACAFTSVAILNGTLTGNALQGSIVWKYSTNNASDCGYRATCETLQSFTGARPPPSGG